jgi:capsular exopolysaccharide synthesis family protein
MGRVYEALKRASLVEEIGDNDSEVTSTKRNGSGPSPIRPVSSNKGAIVHPWDQTSKYFIGNGSQRSAPTAHTDVNVGSALPDVMASRDAGATLGAERSARAVEFPEVEVSPARVEPHFVAITQPRSAYSEQFRSLRTRVLHAAERRNMRAFVITSSDVAEGKTLTALNLAWLLAQTDGVRALLIDADLRQPCTHEYLGIEPREGLAEVLAGERKLTELIRRLIPSGLHLLQGGAPRDDVAELLSGPRFAAVMTEARTMFDFIIIDAPPLGIFTDASVLINRADGALMVVRSGKTQYALVSSLLETLPRERMLGVVLNRTEEKLDESSYYYQRPARRPSVAAMKDVRQVQGETDEVGELI